MARGYKIGVKDLGAMDERVPPFSLEMSERVPELKGMNAQRQ